MPSLRDEITKTFLRLGRRGTEEVRVSSRLLAPGTELGSYRILKQLGEGGMGQVYLALDTHLNRKVALKVLPPEFTSSQTYLRRFQQEARTASALNHPNILTIFEFPEIGGRHVIVSEFVEGQTLRQLLNGKLELGQGLEIMTQVASALAAAHAAGVIHRDLKPTNIMVRPDGYVKIIDFGLAKLTQRGARGDGESWTMPGAVLGTAGYMSPEQARGEETDARTDIWSFGVILYEVMTGAKPFEGPSDNHVIVAILDHPPRPIPDGNEPPAELVAIVHKALAKEKKARYQSADQLLRDLRKVQGATDAPVRPVGIPDRRRRLSRVALGAACLSLVAAFGVWWWPLNGRYRVLGPDWFEIGSSRRLTFVGNVQRATLTPDAKGLAYVTAAHGAETLHWLDLTTNAERQLAPTSSHFLGLTFSPDGKTLFYVAKDVQQELGRLFSVPSNGIGSTPPSVLLEDLDSEVALSPDGQRFAFVRGTGQGSQEVNRILIGSANNPRNPYTAVSLTGTAVGTELAWSPNDQWLALLTYPAPFGGSSVPHLSLYRPSGQSYRDIAFKAVRRLRSPVVLDGGSLLVFGGMPHGGQQYALMELFLPTGQIHEHTGDVMGLESVSASADSQSLAAVRLDERSSIWVADKDALDAPQQITPDAEKITSVEWLDDESVVFPSTRSGNVNLVKLDGKGNISPLSAAQSCVETEPSTAPGGDTVVYASNCGSEGDDYTIWAVNLKNSHVRQLTTGSNFDQEPSLSPHGDWVYYTSWSSNSPSIWKTSVAGGAPIRVLPMEARAPVVSPDGTKLAVSLFVERTGWVVVVVRTDDGTILQRFPKIPVRRPLRWSPDGTALDYANDDSTSSGIWRQSLAGGRPELLIRVSEGAISSFAWNQSGTKLAYVRARDQKDAILFNRSHTK